VPVSERVEPAFGYLRVRPVRQRDARLLAAVAGVCSLQGHSWPTSARRGGLDGSINLARLDGLAAVLAAHQLRQPIRGDTQHLVTVRTFRLYHLAMSQTSTLLSEDSSPTGLFLYYL